MVWEAPRTALPDVVAMALRSAKTDLTSRGLGLNMVRCVPRESLATVPRSPVFLYSALTWAADRPIDSPIALIRSDSPMPSSMPS